MWLSGKSWLCICITLYLFLSVKASRLQLWGLWFFGARRKDKKNYRDGSTVPLEWCNYPKKLNQNEKDCSMLACRNKLLIALRLLLAHLRWVQSCCQNSFFKTCPLLWLHVWKEMVWFWGMHRKNAFCVFFLHPRRSFEMVPSAMTAVASRLERKWKLVRKTAFLLYSQNRFPASLVQEDVT